MRRLPLPPKPGSRTLLLLQRQKAPWGSLCPSSWIWWSHPFLCFLSTCRPKTYHTSLKVAWDLNTGIFVTVSVGDLTEVKGQTR